MIGLKQKRRNVRNPFMNSQYYHPYQGFPNQPNYQQNMYQSPYPASNNQPVYYPPNYQQAPYSGQGYTPFQMPYPNQGTKPSPTQKGGFQSILNQFKTNDGGYDMNKMMNTAGQMMNTVNQLNGMVKQVGSFFKAKV